MEWNIIHNINILSMFIIHLKSMLNHSDLNDFHQEYPTFQILKKYLKKKLLRHLMCTFPLPPQLSPRHRSSSVAFCLKFTLPYLAHEGRRGLSGINIVPVCQEGRSSLTGHWNGISYSLMIFFLPACLLCLRLHGIISLQNQSSALSGSGWCEV